MRAVLVLAGTPTATSRALGDVARARGMDVVTTCRPGGPGDHHWYGGPLAADRDAAGWGIGLLEPTDPWLATLPFEYVQRRIELTTLARAWALDAPAFVKPPSDKQFPAVVYPDGLALPRTGARIAPGAPVLIADPVVFDREYRLFVLDGRVVTGSRYLTGGRLDPLALRDDPLRAEVAAFAHDLLAAVAGTLPSAVVIDVGRIEGGPWAVVEANMAWFAQRYLSDTDAMLDVVLRSAGPLRLVAERDRGFVRGLRAPSVS